MIIKFEGDNWFLIIGKVYLLFEDNKKIVVILKFCVLGLYYNYFLLFLCGFG